MSDKMPEMTEEAVQLWLLNTYSASTGKVADYRCAEPSRAQARAVLALVSAKVREAVRVSDPYGALPEDAIVARVLGEEAPRG